MVRAEFELLEGQYIGLNQPAMTPAKYTIMDFWAKVSSEQTGYNRLAAFLYMDGVNQKECNLLVETNFTTNQITKISHGTNGALEDAVVTGWVANSTWYHYVLGCQPGIGTMSSIAYAHDGTTGFGGVQKNIGSYTSTLDYSVIGELQFEAALTSIIKGVVVKDIYIWKFQGASLHTSFHSQLYTNQQSVLKGSNLAVYGAGYEFILEYKPMETDDYDGTNSVNQYLTLNYQMCYSRYGFFCADGTHLCQCANLAVPKQIVLNQYFCVDAVSCVDPCSAGTDKCTQSDLPAFCLTSCDRGYYYDSALLQCYPCTSPCRTCSISGSNCTTCADGYFLERASGSCLSNCNTVANTTADTASSTCMPVDQNCLKHDDITNACQSSTQCKHGYFFHDQVCVNACPTEFYYDAASNSCMACADNCTECTSSSCFLCKTGYYLKDGACHDNTVLTDCGVDQFNDTAEGACMECHPDCSACTNVPTNCTACKSKYLLGNRCVPFCPKYQFYQNSTVLECQPCADANCQVCSVNKTSCDVGFEPCFPGTYLATTGHCIKCHADCVTCDNLDTKSCLSCDSSSNRFLLNRECVNDCPDGTYKDYINSACTPCTYPCLACSSATVCGQCDNGFNLILGKCQVGFYLKAETGKTPALPLNPNIATTNVTEFSLEIWFKKDPGSVQPPNQIVLGAYPWKIKLSAIEDAYLMTYKNSFTFCPIGNLDGSKWYFWSFTLSTEFKLECYLNAEETSIGIQNPEGPTQQMEKITEITLGNSINIQGTEVPYHGFFLELRYWKVRRTPRHIKDFMIRSWAAGTVPSTLLAYWRLIQEFHNTNITDFAGGGLKYDSSTNTPSYNIMNEYLPFQGLFLLICENGYYLDASIYQCNPCDTQCETCTSSAALDCLSCTPPNFWDTNLKQCVPTCPTYTYADAEERICLDCYRNCKICTGNPTNCSICKPGTFQIGQTCNDQCAAGQYGDKNTSICRPNPVPVITSPANNSRFSINDEITLEGNITPQNGEDYSIWLPKWSVVRLSDGLEIGNDVIKPYYRNRVDLERVHLDRNILEINQQYEVTFKPIAANASRYINMLGSDSIRIYVGHPPENGTCTIDKTEGKPEQTVFNITAPGWQDLQGISEYRFKFSLDNGKNYFPIVHQKLWVNTINFTFPLLLANTSVIVVCEVEDAQGFSSQANTTTKLYLNQITIVNLPVTTSIDLLTLSLSTLLGTNTYVNLAHYLMVYNEYFSNQPPMTYEERRKFNSYQSNCMNNGTALCGNNTCLESWVTQGFYCKCKDKVYGKKCEYVKYSEYVFIQNMNEGLMAQYDGNFTFDLNPQQAGFFLQLTLTYPEFLTLNTLNSAASILKKYVDSWGTVTEQDVEQAMDAASQLLEGYNHIATSNFVTKSDNPDANSMKQHVQLVRDAMDALEVKAIKLLKGSDAKRVFSSSGVSFIIQRATNLTNLQLDPSNVALKEQRSVINVHPKFLQSITLPNNAVAVVKQYKRNPYQGAGNTSTGVVSASIYDTSTSSKVVVNGSTPFQISLSVHKNDKYLLLTQLYNKYSFLKESHRQIRSGLMDSWKHKCVYWNGGQQIWDTNGCTLDKISPTHVVCQCTHMSDFTSTMVPPDNVIDQTGLDNPTTPATEETSSPRWVEIMKKPGPYFILIYFFLFFTSLSTHIYKDRKYRYNLSIKYIREDLHYYVQPVEQAFEDMDEGDLVDEILISAPDVNRSSFIDPSSVPLNIDKNLDDFVDKFSIGEIGNLKTKADYMFDKAEVLPTLKQEAVAILKLLFSNTLPLNYMLRTSNLTPRYVKVVVYFSGVAWRLSLVWAFADQWRSMEIFNSATTFFVNISVTANLLNFPLRLLLILLMRVPKKELMKFQHMVKKEVNFQSRILHKKMRIWYLATILVACIPIIIMVLSSLWFSYWWSVSEGFKFLTNFMIFIIMDLILVPLSINLIHLFLAIVAMRVPIFRCVFVQLERFRLFRNMEGNMHIW